MALCSELKKNRNYKYIFTFRLKLKIIILFYLAMFEANMSSSAIGPVKNNQAVKSFVQKLISSP